MDGKSGLHNFLEEYGKKFLRNRGYYEIHTEYPITIDGKHYKVDLVGFDGYTKTKIAIECGATTLNKLNDLKKYFNEVIHLTIINVLSDTLEVISKLENEIRLLQRKNEEIEKAQNKFFQDFYSYMISNTKTFDKRGGRTAMLRIRCSEEVKNKFYKFMKTHNFKYASSAIFYMLNSTGAYEKEILKIPRIERY